MYRLTSEDVRAIVRLLRWLGARNVPISLHVDIYPPRDDHRCMCLLTEQRSGLGPQWRGRGETLAEAIAEARARWEEDDGS